MGHDSVPRLPAPCPDSRAARAGRRDRPDGNRHRGRRGLDRATRFDRRRVQVRFGLRRPTSPSTSCARREGSRRGGGRAFDGGACRAAESYGDRRLRHRGGTPTRSARRCGRRAQRRSPITRDGSEGAHHRPARLHGGEAKFVVATRTPSGSEVDKANMARSSHNIATPPVSRPRPEAGAPGATTPARRAVLLRCASVPRAAASLPTAAQWRPELAVAHERGSAPLASSDRSSTSEVRRPRLLDSLRRPRGRPAAGSVLRHVCDPEGWLPTRRRSRSAPRAADEPLCRRRRRADPFPPDGRRPKRFRAPRRKKPGPRPPASRSPTTAP